MFTTHQSWKRPGDSWRLDETYLKVKGKWRYYYRAVDKQVNTIEFLLTAKRDAKAALRCFSKAIGKNDKPGLINIDKSGANKADIKQFNSNSNRLEKIHQCKYHNNIVEQDNRGSNEEKRSELFVACRSILRFSCASRKRLDA